MADRVAVMYAGKIVEEGPVDAIFADPRHPYTLGLLRSIPRLDDAGGERLRPIAGMPPSLAKIPSGCAFHPRCEFAEPRCRERYPTERVIRGQGRTPHRVHCHVESVRLRPGEEAS
jgi:peptide/nickel transport system ATP-binding protein/oligopeptide transport system ATP-binding protein